MKASIKVKTISEKFLFGLLRKKREIIVLSFGDKDFYYKYNHTTLSLLNLFVITNNLCHDLIEERKNPSWADECEATRRYPAKKSISLNCTVCKREISVNTDSLDKLVDILNKQGRVITEKEPNMPWCIVGWTCKHCYTRFDKSEGDK